MYVYMYIRVYIYTHTHTHTHTHTLIILCTAIPELSRSYVETTEVIVITIHKL